MAGEVTRAQFVGPDGSKSSVTIAGAVPAESFSGSASQTYTFSTPMISFVITNDGAASLTFVINGVSITVKQGEIFDEYFDPFTQVGITATTPYRAYGRKVSAP